MAEKKPRKKKGGELQYLVIDIDDYIDRVSQENIVSSEAEAVELADDMKDSLIVSGFDLRLHTLETKSFLADMPPPAIDEAAPTVGPLAEQDTEPEPVTGNPPPDGVFVIKNADNGAEWISDAGVYDVREKRLEYESRPTAQLIADRYNGVVIDLTPEPPAESSQR